MSDHVLSINIKAKDKAVLDNLIVTVESIQGDGSELNAVEIYSMEGQVADAVRKDASAENEPLHNQFSVDCWLSPFNTAT